MNRQELRQREYQTDRQTATETFFLHVKNYIKTVDFHEIVSKSQQKLNLGGIGY